MGIRREFPDFRVQTKWKMCEGMYDPQRCTCVQKTARGLGVEEIDELSALLQDLMLEKQQKGQFVPNFF